MITFIANHTPVIGPDSVIHPSADIVGAVEIGRGCRIGRGTSVLGEYGRVVIGDNARIGSECVIEAGSRWPLSIGSSVEISDGARIHAQVHVGDRTVIGRGCVISEVAVIGKGALIGDSATVAQRQKIPTGGIAMGSPAHVLEKRLHRDSQMQPDSRVCAQRP